MGTGAFLVAIEDPAGDPRNFLVVDGRPAVLYHGDAATDQRDVESLPFSGFARKLRRGGQEAVHTADVMAGWLVNRIGFHLDFVSATQINPAVGSGGTVEFHMQSEVAELRIVDELRPIPPG
jgi:hypothetical protein